MTDFVIRFAITQGWITAIPTVAAFAGVVMAIEAWTPRERLAWSLVTMASVGLLVGMAVLHRSDRGKWEAVQADPTTLNYAQMFAARPDSRYADSARAIVRTRQAVRLAAPATEVGRTILEAVVSQDTLPGRIAVFVDGERRYQQLTGDNFRYAAELDEFAGHVVAVVQELVGHVGGRAYRATNAEQTSGIAFAFRYTAYAGWEYSQGPYRYQAISLEADWRVFVAGDLQELHRGEVPRVYAPTIPRSIDPRTPEETLVAVVAQRVLNAVAEALGVAAPDLGVW